MNSKILPKYRKGWASNPGLNYRSIRTPKKIEFSILAGLPYKIQHPIWKGVRFGIETFGSKHLKILNPYIPRDPGLLSSFPSLALDIVKKHRYVKRHYRQCREDFSCTNDIRMSSSLFSPAPLYSPCIYPCVPPEQYLGPNYNICAGASKQERGLKKLQDLVNIYEQELGEYMWD